jgi:DNA repair exonuclease SbcCD nuclease subunit
VAKILLFSDLHLHNWPQFSHTDPETGLNSRLVDQLTVLAQIRDVCEKEDIDALIFLGDLFHSRTKIDVDVLWAAHESCYQLSKAVPEFYILVGNHDQSTRDGSIHSLDGFRYFANVIDEPKKLTVADHWAGYFHPFTTDFDAFRKFCASIPPGEKNLFFGHQGISEADVSVKDLPSDRCRYVFMGHYHKHQWVRDNVAYIGSPLQLDFGERTEQKGFLILDSDVPAPRNVEFRFSKAPKFKLYEDADKFYTDLKNDRLDPKRDFVRVHGQAKDIRNIQQDHPRIQVVQAAVPYEHPSRIDPAMTASDKALLSAYIEGASDGTLSKDRLLQMGLDLLGVE